MANNNNIYYNAAFCGFIGGALQGRAIKSSPVAADYLDLTQAAQAFAQRVDSLIVEDVLVTTGGGSPAQLDMIVNVPPPTPNNTIAANEQWRAGVLKDICMAVVAGRYPTSEVAADYADLAAATFAAFTEAKLLLVTP